MPFFLNGGLFEVSIYTDFLIDFLIASADSQAFIAVMLEMGEKIS